MYVTCLDLEGVLVPEVWIAFAEETKIRELRLTTRDMPDYDALMKRRIAILREHKLGLRDVQATIGKIDPLPGAREFLDELRLFCQTIILSDTFTQFALPLMKKLGMPTIFCNSLEIAGDGMISGYRLRQQNGKLNTVKALQSIGFRTIAAGDSFNDLAMIHGADAGFLFRAPEQIIADNSDVPTFTEYNELLAAILAQMEGQGAADLKKFNTRT
ncbi:MAG: bifunctional phosphoserine phosphatase/homoserine phosphotransferase ThrH [Spirochaetaceae bacterium]|jgi:phosphoserine/homoserine phosphotransferase|nr:bifunctional phosphoserine phosphatase/homoserine phosphotransferase ThrH [Spirochaetaceae bacterium]